MTNETILKQAIEKANKEELENYIKENWGDRCKTTDWEDFPEDKGNRYPEKVCPCCEAWRCYDYIVGNHLKEDE